MKAAAKRVTSVANALKMSSMCYEKASVRCNSGVLCTKESMKEGKAKMRISEW